ncbi:MAG: Fe(3+) ABC transporter substrate-binding protein [Flavobacteriales bacterium]
MKKSVFAILTAMTIWSCGNKESNATKPDAIEQENVVNIYTHRFYDTDKQIIDLFEKETGIKVNVKKDKADKLIALLQAEGKKSEADILVTVDAGRLGYAKSLDLLQPFESDYITKTVPAHLIDSENNWVSLTQRARVIAYDKEKVKPEDLSTYEALTEERWKGQINVRSSNNIYNQSLMASIIANTNKEEAVEWASGIVSNMARPPKGNDRDQVKQVALGEGSLAIINTYYLGKLINSSNQLEAEAGRSVGLFFPNQNTTGTHINVSGAGITKYAPNKDNATKFIEFLLSPTAQKMYAKSNYEYPVHPNVEPSELLKSWGDFKMDELSLEKLYLNNQTAKEVFEAANWK